MANVTTKTAARAGTKNRKGHTGNGKRGATNGPDGDMQAELQHENDKLREKLQALEAEANQLKTTLERDNEVLRAKVTTLQNTGQPQPVVPVIPKPKGNLYNLQKKMGLEDDPMKYNEIKATWKKLIRVAAFEDGVTFANQPKEKIVKFAKKARVTVPFLRRFRADWATEMYLRRSLRNRKGYLKRTDGQGAAGTVDIDIASDDDHGLEDDEGENSDEMDDN